TTVVLTATPDASSTFGSWSGCDSVVGAQCTIVVTATKTVTATFQPIPASTPDTTPPTVTMTAPVNGTIVSNTVSVTATASDNVGVVGVQFTLDGATLGAEVTVPPYAVSWNTTTATNTTHILTAVARDAAGNVATGTSITVTVANDTIPPTVAITAPVAATTVTGKPTITASATD